MQPLRRQARSPRERPRQWPLVLGVGSMVVLCTSILAMRATTSPRRVATAIAPPRVEPVAPIPVRVVEPDEPPREPRAKAGTCSTRLVPSRMVQHVSAEEAAELVTLLDEWLASEDSFGARPSIEYKRGVLYIQAEEDRGDDPPYPRSASPEAERECGSAAGWLRSHLHERLAHGAGDDVLQCEGNVCCYSGMEYAPDGLVVFRRRDTDGGEPWALAAWAEYQTAALGAEYVEANVRHVERSFARLDGTRCTGEPPGGD